MTSEFYELTLEPELPSLNVIQYIGDDWIINDY